MNVDAHYYAVLGFALACGFKKESALTLAYASQFVDDAKINQLTIQGSTQGIDPDCPSTNSLLNMATCHSYLRLKTFTHAAMINNTCAFHFVPGGKGPDFAWQMTCRPAGTVLQQIREAVLEIDDPVNFGVFLHAWADSFSHQGFSGLPSKPNDIECLCADERVYFSSGVYLSKPFRWLKQDLLRGKFDDILDYLVPAYGHAQALNYPDEPYIRKWSYTYDADDVYYHGPIPAVRNNPVIYRRAFESIADLLEAFLERHPSHRASSQTVCRIPHATLYRLLFSKKSVKNRVKQWQKFLSQLPLFSPADRHLKYDATRWLKQAFENFKTNKDLSKNRRIVTGAILTKNFRESNWYRYYLAVHWYKKHFHQYCHKAGLAFEHRPYYP